MKIQAPWQQPTQVPSKYTTPDSVTIMSAMGTINKTTTVYYGPSTTYPQREYLSLGTGVTAIESEGSYYLIEYSSGGLVRGYVPMSSVDVYGYVPTANNNIIKFGLNIYGSTATVYGGPTTSHASIGTVSNREIVTALKTDGLWYHIEYWTSSGNKRGYIQQTRLSVPGLIYPYNMPISSGTRSTDYGTHQGIDILCPAVSQLMQSPAGQQISSHIMR